MGGVSNKQITDGEAQLYEDSRLEHLWQEIVARCESTLGSVGHDSAAIVDGIRSIQRLSAKLLVGLDARSLRIETRFSGSDQDFETYLAQALANAVRVTVSSDAFAEYIAAEDELYAESYLAWSEGVDETTQPDEG